MARPTAAVVGAGLSGLTAAFRLQQAGWRVTVFEANDRVGGRVQTHRADGYQVDVGASAFSGAYSAYLALVDELGLGYRAASPIVGIVRDHRVHDLDLDRMLASGARTRLLSRRAKARSLRLGLDVARAKVRGRLDYDDMRKAAPLDTETAASYARRALSDELDAYVAEPVVRTMLIANTDQVSKVELFSGVANIFSAGILAIEGGQGRVPEALADVLDVQLQTEVRSVVRRSDGRVDVATATGHEAAYDAAIVAAPLRAAAAMCHGHAAAFTPLLEGLQYTSCLKVAIGFTATPRSRASLIMLPSREDRDIALLFLEHNKAADRVPPGHALIDACWETNASRGMIDASDGAIVARTLPTITRLFPELADAVAFSHVTRWSEALPLTSVGAYSKIGDFVAGIPADAPIQFASDYMSAAGQNTAVALGTRAAQRLLAQRPTPVRHAGAPVQPPMQRTYTP